MSGWSIYCLPTKANYVIPDQLIGDFLIDSGYADLCDTILGETWFVQVNLDGIPL